MGVTCFSLDGYLENGAVVPSDCRASPDVCGQVAPTPHLMDLMQCFKRHRGHFQ